MFQRPLTLILLQKYRVQWESYRDTNWWCIYYFLPSGVHTFAKSMAIQMGGVSRYFSKVSGSGVDLILLSPNIRHKTPFLD